MLRKTSLTLALGLVVAVSASASVVSWNFDNNGTVTGSTHFAGVVSVANWNNSWPSNPTTNLIDDAGAATTLDISYSSFGNYRIQASHPGVDGDGTYNSELLNGYLNSGSTQTPATSSVSLSQISYASYDLIVYFSSDVAGRTGTVTDGTTTYDFSTIGLTSVSGTNAILTQTTSTGGSNPLANYAIFSGLTGTTKTITVNIPNFGGIAGFQLVEAAAIPEPSTTVALFGGAAVLAALITRRRRLRA